MKAKMVSEYTTDIVADSVQFLEPRNSGGAPASPQNNGQTYGNTCRRRSIC